MLQIYQIFYLWMLLRIFFQSAATLSIRNTCSIKDVASSFLWTWLLHHLLHHVLVDHHHCPGGAYLQSLFDFSDNLCFFCRVDKVYLWINEIFPLHQGCASLFHSQYLYICISIYMFMFIGNLLRLISICIKSEYKKQALNENLNYFLWNTLLNSYVNSLFKNGHFRDSCLISSLLWYI